MYSKARDICRKAYPDVQADYRTCLRCLLGDKDKKKSNACVSSNCLSSLVVDADDALHVHTARGNPVLEHCSSRPLASRQVQAALRAEPAKGRKHAALTSVRLIVRTLESASKAYLMVNRTSTSPTHVSPTLCSSITSMTLRRSLIQTRVYIPPQSCVL